MKWQVIAVIYSIFDYKRLIEEITKTGLEVNGTYEVIGSKVNFVRTTSEYIKEMFEISNEFEQEFMESIYHFEEKKIGPYITEKYFLLIPELKIAIQQMVKDCIKTRRCVIAFPKEHCFQSIQFLVRENTINIVCYMRSCDAIKNLPHDAWLCYKLADIFSFYFTQLTEERPYDCHKLTMVFGSLHVFKEDIANVL